MTKLLLTLAVSLSVIALADKAAEKKKAAPAAQEEGPSDESPPSEEAPEPLPPGMTEGPTTSKLGSNAEIVVPKGVVYANKSATAKLLTDSGNLVNGQELGSLLGPDDAWVLFEYDAVGYVKDDEELDADKMLKSMQEDQESANETLKSKGLSELEITGWQVKPHYDPATHNLEWAPLVQNIATKKQSVNYNVKLLGRRGVMTVTLLVPPEKLDVALPWFRDVMKGYSFVKGEDYSSWIKGDKVAEYGLAALVVGGGVAAAAKSGILAKLLKPILVGLAALGAGIKKLFTGGKSESSVIKSDQDRES
jgi:uncharacterized membrane-anchored protein